MHNKYLDTYSKGIKIIAIINVLVALVDKIILLMRGAFGAPVLLTAVLWYFILKQKRWAYYIYSILCFLITALGLLGIFTFFAYLYRGFSPFPSALMVVVGINYAVSWVMLYKENRQLKNR